MEVRGNAARYIYPRRKASAESNDKVKDLMRQTSALDASKCCEEVTARARAREHKCHT